MENEHVVSGLIRKRAEIAGALEDAQNKVRELTLALDNLDGAIRVFAPEMDLSEARPKPLPVRHAAFKGEIIRAIYAALRSTGETLSTHDLTLRVMAARNLNPSDLMFVRVMQKRVGSTLRQMRLKGRVRSEALGGGQMGWRKV